MCYAMLRFKISLNRFCRPILSKPKPAKPVTPESPATPPPQGNEAQPQGADANANPDASPNRSADSSENAPAGSDETSPASTEPMETEKPETTA